MYPSDNYPNNKYPDPTKTNVYVTGLIGRRRCVIRVDGKAVEVNAYHIRGLQIIRDSDNKIFLSEYDDQDKKTIKRLRLKGLIRTVGPRNQVVITDFGIKVIDKYLERMSNYVEREFEF